MTFEEWWRLNCTEADDRAMAFAAYAAGSEQMAVERDAAFAAGARSRDAEVGPVLAEAARCLGYAARAVHEREQCTAAFEDCILADCIEARQAGEACAALLAKHGKGET